MSALSRNAALPADSVEKLRFELGHKNLRIAGTTGDVGCEVEPCGRMANASQSPVARHARNLLDFVAVIESGQKFRRSPIFEFFNRIGQERTLS
jgi:hypothetical protein